ncbi:hypothetical protein V496_10184 [Pseudogymnoascus sp. VKM F-4515 (FW-2607)]|nr:hypothetical protein V496_10184 [Pseudogymnoascus sp. VKM F-4515 (FW-2607)]KFY95439.1 hypothetical protein V498_03357 [Pseudogymnoascus sp. VKM F-4517 (FW-2822)]
MRSACSAWRVHCACSVAWDNCDLGSNYSGQDKDTHTPTFHHHTVISAKETARPDRPDLAATATTVTFQKKWKEKTRPGVPSSRVVRTRLRKLGELKSTKGVPDTVQYNTKRASSGWYGVVPHVVLCGHPLCSTHPLLGAESRAAPFPALLFNNSSSFHENATGGPTR